MTQENLFLSFETQVNYNAITALERRLQALEQRPIRFGIRAADVNKLNKDLGSYRGHLDAIGRSRVMYRHGQDIAVVNRNLRQSGYLMQEYGKIVGLAARRFTAYAAGAMSLRQLGGALSSAVSEAIKFDDAMVRVGQILGTTRAGVVSLEKDINQLAVRLGASSTELSNLSVTLAQSGMGMMQVKQSLDAIAKSSLSPTFTDMTNTAEGVIAAMSQFEMQGYQVEKMLSQINIASKKYAVEADDMITAIRKTGSVFAELYKDIGNYDPLDAMAKMQAMFGTIRSTSRESADTIGTALRTIVARMQRPETLRVFKNLGIELTDLQGKLLGPYEAIQKISSALEGMGAADPRMAQLVEVLGGVRQMSKVIPMLSQRAKMEDMYKTQLEGTGSLEEDREKRMDTWIVKIGIVRENFRKLIRDISEDSAFKTLGTSILNVANGAIKIVDNMRPVLPMLMALGAIKMIGAAGSMIRGVSQGFTQQSDPSTGGIGVTRTGGREFTLDKTNTLLSGILDNTRLSREYIGKLTHQEMVDFATGPRLSFGNPDGVNTQLLKHISALYRNQEGSHENISGLVTNVITAGQKLPQGGRAKTDMMEIYTGQGKSILVETNRVVQGTTVIHNDLQGIRSIIADLFRYFPGGVAGMHPQRREYGGVVPKYHQFGSFIKSGIVPPPTGKAAADAQGWQRGTDIAAHTVEPGSFVMNAAATKAFGYSGRPSYRSGGGIPVMLSVNERVFSPEEVGRIGLGKLTAQNQAGRGMKYRRNGGLVRYLVDGGYTEWLQQYGITDSEQSRNDYQIFLLVEEQKAELATERKARPATRREQFEAERQYVDPATGQRYSDPMSAIIVARFAPIPEFPDSEREKAIIESGQEKVPYKRLEKQSRPGTLDFLSLSKSKPQKAPLGFSWRPGSISQFEVDRFGSADVKLATIPIYSKKEGRTIDVPIDQGIASAQSVVENAQRKADEAWAEYSVAVDMAPDYHERIADEVSRNGVDPRIYNTHLYETPTFWEESFINTFGKDRVPVIVTPGPTQDEKRLRYRAFATEQAVIDAQRQVREFAKRSFLSPVGFAQPDPIKVADPNILAQVKGKDPLGGNYPFDLVDEKAVKTLQQQALERVSKLPGDYRFFVAGDQERHAPFPKPFLFKYIKSANYYDDPVFDTIVPMSLARVARDPQLNEMFFGKGVNAVEKIQDLEYQQYQRQRLDELQNRQQLTEEEKKRLEGLLGMNVNPLEGTGRQRLNNLWTRTHEKPTLLRLESSVFGALPGRSADSYGRVPATSNSTWHDEFKLHPEGGETTKSYAHIVFGHQPSDEEIARQRELYVKIKSSADNKLTDEEREELSVLLGKNIITGKDGKRQRLSAKGREELSRLLKIQNQSALTEEEQLELQALQDGTKALPSADVLKILIDRERRLSSQPEDIDTVVESIKQAKSLTSESIVSKLSRNQGEDIFSNRLRDVIDRNISAILEQSVVDKETGERLWKKDSKLASELVLDPGTWLKRLNAAKRSGGVRKAYDLMREDNPISRDLLLEAQNVISSHLGDRQSVAQEYVNVLEGIKQPNYEEVPGAYKLLGLSGSPSAMAAQKGLRALIHGQPKTSFATKDDDDFWGFDTATTDVGYHEWYTLKDIKKPDPKNKDDKYHYNRELVAKAKSQNGIIDQLIADGYSIPDKTGVLDLPFEQMSADSALRSASYDAAGLDDNQKLITERDELLKQARPIWSQGGIVPKATLSRLDELEQAIEERRTQDPEGLRQSIRDLHERLLGSGATEQELRRNQQTTGGFQKHSSSRKKTSERLDKDPLGVAMTKQVSKFAKEFAIMARTRGQVKTKQGLTEQDKELYEGQWKQSTEMVRRHMMRRLEDVVGARDEMFPGVYDAPDHIMQVIYATFASMAKGQGERLVDPAIDTRSSKVGLERLIGNYENSLNVLMGSNFYSGAKPDPRNESLLFQEYFDGVQSALVTAFATGQDNKRIEELQNYCNEYWQNFNGFKFETNPFTGSASLTKTEEVLGTINGHALKGKVILERPEGELSDVLFDMAEVAAGGVSGRLNQRYEFDADTWHKIITSNFITPKQIDKFIATIPQSTKHSKEEKEWLIEQLGKWKERRQMMVDQVKRSGRIGPKTYQEHIIDNSVIGTEDLIDYRGIATHLAKRTWEAPAIRELQGDTETRFAKFMTGDQGMGETIPEQPTIPNIEEITLALDKDRPCRELFEDADLYGTTVGDEVSRWYDRLGVKENADIRNGIKLGGITGFKRLDTTEKQQSHLIDVRINASHYPDEMLSIDGKLQARDNQRAKLEAAFVKREHDRYKKKHQDWMNTYLERVGVPTEVKIYEKTLEEKKRQFEAYKDLDNPEVAKLAREIRILEEGKKRSTFHPPKQQKGESGEDYLKRFSEYREKVMLAGQEFMTTTHKIRTGVEERPFAVVPMVREPFQFIGYGADKLKTRDANEEEVDALYEAFIKKRPEGTEEEFIEWCEAVSEVRNLGLRFRDKGGLVQYLDGGKTVSPITPGTFADIFEAVKKGSLQDVQRFIESGVDVNVRNSSGSTPLHFAAAFSSDNAILEYLIHQGADLDAISSMGYSSIDFAKTEAKKHILRKAQKRKLQEASDEYNKNNPFSKVSKYQEHLDQARWTPDSEIAPPPALSFGDEEQRRLDEEHYQQVYNQWKEDQKNKKTPPVVTPPITPATTGVPPITPPKSSTPTPAGESAIKKYIAKKFANKDSTPITPTPTEGSESISAPTTPDAPHLSTPALNTPPAPPPKTSTGSAGTPPPPIPPKRKTLMSSLMSSLLSGTGGGGSGIAGGTDTPRRTPASGETAARSTYIDWGDRWKIIDAIKAEQDQMQKMYLLQRYEHKFGQAGSTLKRHMEIVGFRTGGHVPGYGGGDRVPAFLERGEFVVRKEVAKEYLPELQGLNRSGLGLKNSLLFGEEGFRDIVGERYERRGIDKDVIQTRDKTFGMFRDTFGESFGRINRRRGIERDSDTGTGQTVGGFVSTGIGRERKEIQTKKTSGVDTDATRRPFLEGSKSKNTTRRYNVYSGTWGQVGGRTRPDRIKYVDDGDLIMRQIEQDERDATPSNIVKASRIMSTPGIMPGAKVLDDRGQSFYIKSSYYTDTSDEMVPDPNYADPHMQTEVLAGHLARIGGLYTPKRALISVNDRNISDKLQAQSIETPGKRQQWQKFIDNGEINYAISSQFLDGFSVASIGRTAKNKKERLDLQKQLHKQLLSQVPTMALIGLRDLHAANILVNQDKPYIIDFGGALDFEGWGERVPGLFTKDPTDAIHQIKDEISYRVFPQMPELAIPNNIIQGKDLDTGKERLSSISPEIIIELVSKKSGRSDSDVDVLIKTLIKRRERLLNLKKYQQGGKIPGYGGGDKIPALLEAGEYIINKQSANRYHSVLEAINNKGIQRFVSGGPVYAADGRTLTEKFAEINGSSTNRTRVPDKIMSLFGSEIKRITDNLIKATQAVGLFDQVTRDASNSIGTSANEIETLVNNAANQGTPLREEQRIDLGNQLKNMLIAQMGIQEAESLVRGTSFDSEAAIQSIIDRVNRVQGLPAGDRRELTRDNFESELTKVQRGLSSFDTALSSLDKQINEAVRMGGANSMTMALMTKRTTLRTQRDQVASSMDEAVSMSPDYRMRQGRVQSHKGLGAKGITNNIERLGTDIARAEEAGNDNEVRLLQEGVKEYQEALQLLEKEAYQRFRDGQDVVDSLKDGLTDMYKQLAEARLKGDVTEQGKIQSKIKTRESEISKSEEKLQPLKERHGEVAGAAAMAGVAAERPETKAEQEIAQYRELIESIKHLKDALVSNTHATEEEKQRMTADITAKEKLAEGVYTGASDRPEVQRKMLGDNGRFEQITKDMDRVLQDRKDYFSDMMATREGTLGQAGFDFAQKTSNRFGNAGSSYMPDGMEQQITFYGLTDPAAAQKLREHWKSQIGETMSQIQDEAQEKLQSLEVELQAVNDKLRTASGEEKRALNSRRKQIERTIKKQNDIISNAGQIQPGTGTEKPEHWLKTGLNTVVGGLEKSQYIIASGAITQALGAQNQWASAIGQGATQGGIYSSMIRNIAPGLGPWGAGAGLAVGALQGGVQGYKDIQIQKAQEDAQRALTESSRQLSSAFSDFVKSGNINKLREVWTQHAAVIQRNNMLELQRQQSLTSYFFGGGGATPEDIIGGGVREKGHLAGGTAAIGVGLTTAAVLSKVLPLIGVAGKFGGPWGWTASIAAMGGTYALSHWMGSEDRSRTTKRAVDAAADVAGQKAEPIGEQFKNIVEKQLSRSDVTLNSIVADPKNIEGVRAAAMAYGNLEQKRNLNALATRRELLLEEKETAQGRRRQQVLIELARVEDTWNKQSMIVAEERLGALAENTIFMRKARESASLATKELNNFYLVMDRFGAIMRSTTEMGFGIDENRRTKEMIYGGQAGIASAVQPFNFQNITAHSRERIEQQAGLLNTVTGSHAQGNRLVLAHTFEQQIGDLVAEIASKTTENVKQENFSNMIKERITDMLEKGLAPAELDSLIQQILSQIAIAGESTGGTTMSEAQFAEHINLANILSQANQKLIKSVEETTKAYEQNMKKFEQSLTSYAQASAAASQKIADTAGGRADIEHRFYDSMRQYVGGMVDINSATAGFRTKMQVLTSEAGVPSTDARVLSKALGRIRDERLTLRDQRDAAFRTGDTEGFIKLGEQEAKLSDRMATLQKAVETLASDTTQLTAIQSKLAEQGEVQKIAQTTMEDLATMSPAEQLQVKRALQNRDKLLATDGAAGRRMLPQDMKAAFQWGSRMDQLFNQAGMMSKWQLNENRRVHVDAAGFALQRSRMIPQPLVQPLWGLGRETHPDQGLLDETARLMGQQIEAQKSLEIAAWKQRDEIQGDLGNIRSILRDQLDIMKGAEAQAKMPQGAEQPIGQAHGGFVHRFSTGGRVPGTGSGDKVRALLEPGEFVIEKNVANRYTSELDRLNKGGIIYANDGRTITNGATPSTIRYPKISKEEKITTGTIRSWDGEGAKQHLGGSLEGSARRLGGPLDRMSPPEFQRPRITKQDIEYLNRIQAEYRDNENERDKQRKQQQRQEIKGLHPGMGYMSDDDIRQASQQHHKKIDADWQRFYGQVNSMIDNAVLTAMPMPGVGLATGLGSKISRWFGNKIPSRAIGSSLVPVPPRVNNPVFVHKANANSRDLLAVDKQRIQEIMDIRKSDYRELSGQYTPINVHIVEQRFADAHANIQKSPGGQFQGHLYLGGKYTHPQYPLATKIDTFHHEGEHIYLDGVMHRRGIDTEVSPTVLQTQEASAVAVEPGLSRINGLRPDLEIVNNNLKEAGQLLKNNGFNSVYGYLQSPTMHSSGAPVSRLLTSRQTVEAIKIGDPLRFGVRELPEPLLYNAGGAYMKVFRDGLSLEQYIDLRAGLIQGMTKDQFESYVNLLPPDVIRSSSIKWRQDGGFIHKFATGGRVPGVGTKDTIPAMLTPGEFVVRAPIAKQYSQFLTKLNNGSEPSVRDGVGYASWGGLFTGIDKNMALGAARAAAAGAKPGEAMRQYRNNLDPKDKERFDAEVKRQVDRISAGKQHWSWSEWWDNRLGEAETSMKVTGHVASDVVGGAAEGWVQLGEMAAGAALEGVNLIDVARGKAQFGEGYMLAQGFVSDPMKQTRRTLTNAAMSGQTYSMLSGQGIDRERASTDGSLESQIGETAAGWTHWTSELAGVLMSGNVASVGIKATRTAATQGFRAAAREALPTLSNPAKWTANPRKWQIFGGGRQAARAAQAEQAAVKEVAGASSASAAQQAVPKVVIQPTGASSTTQRVAAWQEAAAMGGTSAQIAARASEILAEMTGRVGQIIASGVPAAAPSALSRITSGAMSMAGSAASGLWSGITKTADLAANLGVRSAKSAISAAKANAVPTLVYTNRAVRDEMSPLYTEEEIKKPLSSQEQAVSPVESVRPDTPDKDKPEANVQPTPQQVPLPQRAQPQRPGIGGYQQRQNPTQQPGLQPRQQPVQGPVQGQAPINLNRPIEPWMNDFSKMLGQAGYLAKGGRGISQQEWDAEEKRAFSALVDREYQIYLHQTATKDANGMWISRRPGARVASKEEFGRMLRQFQAQTGQPRFTGIDRKSNKGKAPSVRGQKRAGPHDAFLLKMDPAGKMRPSIKPREPGEVTEAQIKNIEMANAARERVITNYQKEIERLKKQGGFEKVITGYEERIEGLRSRMQEVPKTKQQLQDIKTAEHIGGMIRHGLEAWGEKYDKVKPHHILYEESEWKEGQPLLGGTIEEWRERYNKEVERINAWNAKRRKWRESWNLSPEALDILAKQEGTPPSFEDWLQSEQTRVRFIDKLNTRQKNIATGSYDEQDERVRHHLAIVDEAEESAMRLKNEDTKIKNARRWEQQEREINARYYGGTAQYIEEGVHKRATADVDVPSWALEKPVRVLPIPHDIPLIPGTEHFLTGPGSFDPVEEMFSLPGDILAGVFGTLGVQGAVNATFGTQFRTFQQRIKDGEEERRNPYGSYRRGLVRHYSLGGEVGSNPYNVVNPNMAFFKPRGTDTVPALLSDGEFVVNAKSAQKHLSILQHINDGKSLESFGDKPVYRQKGGTVGYFQHGGTAMTGTTPIIDWSEPLNRMNSVFDKAIGGFESFGNTFMNSVDSFASSVGSFAQAAKNIPHTIEMAGTHNVNVMINGAAVLQQLEPGIRRIVEDAISVQMASMRGLNSNSGLPNIS